MLEQYPFKLSFPWRLILPAIIGIATAALSIAISSYQSAIAEERFVAQTQLATANFSATLQNSIDVRLRAGELLGRRFASQNEFEETAFRSEAEITRDLFEDFQALSWVDKSGTIQIVTPIEGNEKAVGLDLTRLPVPHQALELARQTGRTQATRPIELAQGGRGFAAYSPIKGPRGELSFVNMVFRTPPLMTQILEDTGMSDYSVKVSDGKLLIFESRDFYINDITQFRNIEVGGRLWRVDVTPKSILTLRAETWIDEVILIFGLLTAAVTAILAYQLIRRREALHVSEARLREIANNISDAVWVTDANFEEIRYANPALGRMFGLGADDFREEEGHLARRLPDDDAAKVKARVKELIGRSANPADADIGHLRYPISKVTGDDGVVRDIYMRFVALEDSRGNVDRFLGLATDVTTLVDAQEETRKANKRLFQSQKLEAIGKLTGGVAHDFNNLLYIILANAEILNDALTAPTLREAADEIIDAAVRGRDLTKNMLAFAGQSSLQPIVSELNPIVSDAQSWISRALPDSITLEISLAADPWSVFVDRIALESSVLNLVLNAKDAMEDKGTITISTFNHEVSESDRLSCADEKTVGRYAVIAVSDDGPGISADTLDKIFEPFFTTKQIGAGTGLGLSMVQGFAKQSGGFLRVHSVVGNGSTFEIYLPAISDGTARDSEER